MDAEALCMIIDNTREWSEAAYRRCAYALDQAGKLPGQSGDMVKCDLDTAKLVGEVIERLVWDRARLQHGLKDNEKTMTATIFATMLGHIDWAEVGDHYHSRTRERWAYAHDIDPYP